MKENYFIGMQSWFMTAFLDEGVGEAINNMIEMGGVNNLLLAANTDYMSSKKWSTKTRNPKREYVEADGFNYNFDLDYYKKTKIKPVKTKIPALTNKDIFREISTVAKKRELNVYALIQHRFPEIDKYEDMLMVAINGEKIPKVFCHNNLQVMNLYKCMIDNLDKEYQLDGFCLDLVDHYALFGFESLTDELADSLGIDRFPIPELGLTCFCETCVNEAKNEGIDVEKVKEGLLKGIKLGYIPKRIERMTYADEMIRFLQDVPEYLVWLKFRSSKVVKLHRELYEYIKNKNKDYKVGLDIYGAREDWKYQMRFDKIAECCDWIKPMFYSSVLELPLTPEQVGEGVKIAKELSNKQIYPGISCLIDNNKEQIEESFKSAINNKADGLVLSWDYALISDYNMGLIKNKLKELKILY